MVCPSCSNDIVELGLGMGTKNGLRFMAYPINGSVKSAPAEVPEDIADDYSEAHLVLKYSPKSSAALSWRCLQTILNQHGYVGRNLAKQIDAALSEEDTRKALPSTLADTIDAIRSFGNFSTHPIDDKTTNEIIPVEPHEAEFCLDILEEMFDHYYVRPAIAAKRKADLDLKLAAAGKPPSK